MKKFLVFLVAIITAVCIGVTFYQFAKNDEIIMVNTQTIYINYGDKLSLDDLGFLRKKASKETKIDFNAGGDEVTSIIKYDETSQCYIPTSKGGSTTIKISTTNRKYKSFNIDVVVGIGSEEFPYYISNETQLFDVTNQHIDDNANFALVKDIQLTDIHQPIGLIDGGYREFTGKFNGNHHTISNLHIDSCNNGGLFAILGANSQIYNLNIDNALLEGTFTNVGTVAGTCYGNINKVIVTNSTISNDSSSSNTGTVVGLLATDKRYNNTSAILRTAAYTNQGKIISSAGTLGGIAGCVDSGIIHACYTNLKLNNSNSSITGGLVGRLLVGKNNYIRESYSISTINSSGVVGNVVGSISLADKIAISTISKDLVLVGLYFDNSINAFPGVGSDEYNFATSTTFAVNGKSTIEMKTKNTYVYYINSSTNIIYWDNVWYLVDGEYPKLTFAEKFDDVVLDNEQLPTDPSIPDISNPETPNTTAVIISSKEDLIKIFQSSTYVTGNYILNTNIDLGGINWIPVSFSGTFKSSDSANYTISNFNIDGNHLLYAGFFYDLASATVSNITFSGISLTSNSNLETAGFVVGYIRGNVSISNINVINSSVSANCKYFGGICGYADNVISKISSSNIKNVSIDGSIDNIGGIIGYTSESTYIVSCKVVNGDAVKGISRVGGIASVNYGTVYDCCFDGNIQSISTSASAYFGGLVGVNYGSILNSSAFAEISVINPSSLSSGNSYYVGGLSGYNIGSISKSCVYADEFSAKQSAGIVYLAGLTAFNSGTLQHCLADVLNIGSIHSGIYTAGLSVFNYGGKILSCISFGNLNGYQVAGLVRNNTNRGIIDSCMTGLNLSERASYKGYYVASLVYEISSGTISNCSVSADLNCTNSNGWVAGFAGFMPLTNKKFGTISYCIANVSLNGVGNKYLDIAGDGLMKKQRTTGTITNCVISESANSEDVTISQQSKFLWITSKAGSGSNYIIAANSELTKLETYLNPTTCNFDISSGISNSKWLYINESYLPIPRAYVIIFGYDIING